MSTFDAVWQSLDRTVTEGWAPGIVAAIRHRGTTEVYATGEIAFDSPRAMTADTPFRIASLSKPIGGALALLLVADGVFGIDDPVERWLPELANPRVLIRPDAPLDETTAADGPITIRQLLTFTFGLGAIFGDTPLSSRIAELGVGPSPKPPQFGYDEYMTRLATLPLAQQPARRWMYHMGIDALAVLMARATGQSLGELLRIRITEPLGMHSTGFWADAAELPTCYQVTADGVRVFDPPDGLFSRPPAFESVGGGLVSTVPDYLAFLAAIADGTLLPDELKTMMTTDQLTDEQREGIDEMDGGGTSWGLGFGIDLVRTDPWTAPGRYGWTGGLGTSAYVNPGSDLIGIVFTQRMMSGPGDKFEFFWGPVADSVATPH